MGSGRSKHSENSLSYNLDKNKFYSNDISQSSARKLQTQSPLTMPIENTFKCDRCGMIFPTDEALFKHRTRFCIGIIDSSSGRKIYYSDDDDINESTYLTNRSALRKVVQHQLPVEKVILN
jgi:late competence protein required for DNA uptake (superfamily II DNA/RNA helicase)